MRNLNREFSKVVAAVAVVLSLTSGTAHANECIEPVRNANLVKLQNPAQYELIQNAVNAYESYLRLSAVPDFKTFFPELQVYEVLGNEEMLVYVQRLEKVFADIEAARALNPNAPLKSTIKKALTPLLEGEVPAKSIPERLKLVLSRTKKSGGIQRALGELTFEEVGFMTYGSNPLKPSPDSWLGKYIQETGAATVVRTFNKGPNMAEQGGKKLVINVSPQSFEAYKKYMTKHNFLVHAHEPQQGTLYLAHEGTKRSYSGGSGSELAVSSPWGGTAAGSIWPHILLSSTEGQRTNQYFRLLQSNRDVARHPWHLENYCGKGGGYESCTHWSAIIPAGDKMVSRYTFPGKVDQWASNSAYPRDPVRDAQPRVGNLKPYNNDSRLVQNVWKAPGNEPMHSLLGVTPQHLGGEMANPGYVAYSLLSHAKAKRVPFVFRVVDDHTTQIPTEFDPQIRAY